MSFKTNYLSNCTRSVKFLAIGFPCVLCGAEPDSSQFGFLSPDAGSGRALRAFSSRGEAAPDEATLTDGTQEEKSGGSRLWGVVPEWLHLELGLQSIYDDNIFLTADSPEADWINRFTPALRGSSGAPGSALWVLDGSYTPTWTTYATSSVPNSIDQAMAATLHYNGDRLKGATLLSYIETTGNDRFVRNVISTAVSRAELVLNYELTGLTSLESRLLWEMTDRTDIGDQVYDDLETVSFQLSALWQATGLTRFGPSIRLGNTTSTLSEDRTFVEALVRTDYDSSALLKFSGEAGVQWISFDGNQENLVRPSGSLTGLYAINPLWQLTVSAYSRNSPAPSFTNSDLQTSGFSGALNWIPADTLQISAGAGYERARYEFFTGALDQTADYTYGELRVRAGRESSPLTIELFARHRLSDSSTGSLVFRNNQAGVQLNYRF